ncbi:putative uncharacterized protein [Ruminococcus sp. CAG:563]|nr:putative uncharacterized protein [Ruminococcus sp. CAG:563]
MKEYIIRETTDFLSLSTLFHESGMGVTIEERMPDRILKMWRMDDALTGNLMAAVTLEIRDEAYSLGDIAVRNGIQSKGYGKILQAVVFDEAKKLGVKEIWACAKEPEYYIHCGWQEMKWEDSPNIAVYCSTCSKRGNICHPKIMKYTLK